MWNSIDYSRSEITNVFCNKFFYISFENIKHFSVYILSTVVIMKTIVN